MVSPIFLHSSLKVVFPLVAIDNLWRDIFRCVDSLLSNKLVIVSIDAPCLNQV